LDERLRASAEKAHARMRAPPTVPGWLTRLVSSGR
jgi:hypothetical protein